MSGNDVNNVILRPADGGDGPNDVRLYGDNYGVRLTRQYIEALNSGDQASQYIRLTQQYAEALNSGDQASQYVRLTAQYAEVLSSGDGIARLTQLYGEAVTSGDPSAMQTRLTQLYAEVVVDYTDQVKARLTQMYGEVVHSGDPSQLKARLTQMYGEVVHSGDPSGTKARLTQLYSEIVHSLNMNVLPSLWVDTDNFYAPTVSIVRHSRRLTKINEDGSVGSIRLHYLTIAPNLFTDTDSFYAPTISQTSGDQTLVPGLFTDTDTFFSPVVSASYTLTPGLFSDTDTFFAPTVLASYTLTPGLVTDTDTFYAPTVTPDQSLAPGLYSDTDSFYAPTVTAGAVTLLPGLVSDTDTFYAPVIARPIVPGLFSDADVFFAPVVTSIYTLLPGLVSDSDSFYAPALYRTVIPGLFSDSDVFFATVVTSIYTLSPGLVSDGDTVYVPQVRFKVAPSLLSDSDTFHATTVSIANILTPSQVFADTDIFPPFVSSVVFLVESDAYFDEFETVYLPKVAQVINPSWFVETDTVYSATLPGQTIHLFPSKVTDSDTIYIPSVLKQKKQGQGGGNNPGDVDNQKYVSRIIANESGLITSLQVRSKTPQSVGARMIIYADDGTGKPGALLGKSADKFTWIKGDNDCPLLTPVSVLTSQNVWVGLQGNSTFRWDLAPQVAGSYFNANNFTSPPTNPFGVGTVDNQVAPVFIIYLQSATSTILPGLVSDTDTFFAPTQTTVSPLHPPAFNSDDAIYNVVATDLVTLAPALFNDDEILGHVMLTWVNIFFENLFLDSDAIYETQVIASYQIVANSINDEAIYLPTLTNTNTITVGFFSDTDVIYGPLVGQSVFPNLDVGSALFSSDDAFYSPTVTLGEVDLAPGLYVDVDLFYPDTVTPGAVTLAPSLYDDSANDTIYAPSVSSGAVTLLPPFVDADDELIENHDLATTFEADSNFFIDTDNILAPSVLSTIRLYPSRYVENEPVGIADVEALPPPVDLTQTLEPPAIPGDDLFPPGSVGFARPIFISYALQGIFELDTELSGATKTEGGLQAIIDDQRRVAGIFDPVGD